MSRHIKSLSIGLVNPLSLADRRDIDIFDEVRRPSTTQIDREDDDQYSNNGVDEISKDPVLLDIFLENLLGEIVHSQGRNVDE